MSPEEAINELPTLAAEVFTNNEQEETIEKKEVRSVALQNAIEGLLAARNSSKDVRMSSFRKSKCKM